MPLEERRAYFAPPPELPSMGEFGSMQQSFAGSRSENLLRQEVAPLLVDGKMADAEAAIRGWLARAPSSPLRDSLLNTSFAELKIRGWELIAAWVTVPSTTAIGLDFSGHVVSNVIEAHDRPLSFEMGRYATGGYDFGAHPLGELRSLGAEGYVPWQGGFAEIEIGLPISGLSRILLELHRFENSVRPDWSAEMASYGRALVALAEWWCFTAACRLIDEGLRARSFGRQVPVLVGTHDFGSRLPTVAFFTG